MCIFQSESLLKGIQVFGVEDGGECRAVNGSVGFMASFPTLRVSGTCFASTTIFKLMLLIISISIPYVSTGNRSSRVLLLKLSG